MDKVLDFKKAKEAEKIGSAIKEGVMVRVVNTKSPFFSWEGRVVRLFVEQPGDILTGPVYCQISCAHNNFQFPVFTFPITDLKLVRQNA